MQRFLSVDPLTDMYPEWSPYSYVLNNPLIHTDPDGRSVDNEYTVVEKSDGTKTTTYTGSDGGNTTDHITYKDENGKTTGTKSIDVEISSTSGPGNDYKRGQEENLTPGARETHDKEPLSFTAFALLSLGRVASMLGLSKKANKGYKRVKTKSEKKINQGRKDSWIGKEKQAREGLKGTKTKKEKLHSEGKLTMM